MNTNNNSTDNNTNNNSLINNIYKTTPNKITTENYEEGMKIFPREEEIPEKFRVKPIEQKTYLVNGELRKWTGETTDVYSPVCIDDGKEIKQKRLGSYPELTKEASLETLDAAVKAYDNGRGKWPTMSPERRIEHMKEFVKNMSYARDDVINMLMWEIGKSYKDSVKEFDRTVEYIDATISAYKDIENSSRLQHSLGFYHQIKRAALGVALSMGPFNYPLNETYTTLMPLVLTGNTVVVKPAKYGVLLHEPLLEAYKASFPEGVINITYGDGAKVIGPIMESGKINALAFIGSSKVANILSKQHPKPNRLKTILGLEAKNPFIIFDDADLDTTVNECITGSISYNGQRCTAGKILFLQRGIADKFIAEYTKKMDNLTLGMPWTENVAITPLPEKDKTKWMNDYVQDALANGAKLLNKGGKTINTIFTPAVVGPVNDKMKIYHEEQFGPVIPIAIFDDVNEPLEYIINSKYGQQASIFSTNPETIGSLIDPLVNQVCRLNINSQCQRGPDEFPFVGRKDSAVGTLSITDALKIFGLRSIVAAKDTDMNKDIIKYILDNNKSTFITNKYIV